MFGSFALGPERICCIARHRRGRDRAYRSRLSERSSFVIYVACNDDEFAPPLRTADGGDGRRSIGGVQPTLLRDARRADDRRSADDFGRQARDICACFGLAGGFGLASRACSAGSRSNTAASKTFRQGGVLIAAKHQSFLETFALLKYAPDFAIILKRQLTYIPLFGLYLIVSKQIAIDRARGRQALQQIATAAKPVLAAGRQIFIYPEGTRRPPGAPPRYKQGVAAIYAAAGAPCLPVAVNTGLFWRRRGFMRRPGVAVIEYLPPIAPGPGSGNFRRSIARGDRNGLRTPECGGRLARSLACGGHSGGRKL